MKLFCVCAYGVLCTSMLNMGLISILNYFAVPAASTSYVTESRVDVSLKGTFILLIYSLSLSMSIRGCLI